MPIATSAGAYTVGISKQTNETTIPTAAEYSLPVFSGRPQPVQTTSRVEVTDAASIVGDPYKNPDERWEADIVFPAFGAALGRFLQSLWPTDTITGAGPYTHTFSGLGATTPWVAMYDDFTNATLEQTYEAGQCAGMTFSVDENGGPLRVGYRAVGKKPTVASYTETTPQTLALGYFTAQGATLKFEEDNATPATHTNIQQVAVVVDRPVTPLATADGLSVANLGITRLTPSFTMQLIWENWDAYRNTFFGTVSGSVPDDAFAIGSVELNYVHTVQAGWSFKLTLDKVWMRVTPPQPDPAGSPLILAIDGDILLPASGSHVKPVLINAVAVAY
jgi:hypothetical protein